MKRILIAFLCVFLAACGFTPLNDTDGKVLNVEFPLKPTSIAPYETFVPTQIGATETLFTVRDGKLENTLVDDYRQTADDTFEMTVKSGIKFQNGHDLTGDAVKNSIENSLEKSALLKGSIPLESIKVDGQKVTLKMTEPYPEIANALANPFIAIYDTETDIDENDLPIGTGPYEITSYERTKSLQSKKFMHYWQGEPKLDGIHVSFHEDGDMRADHVKGGSIDITTDIPIQRIEDVERSDNATVDTKEGLRVSYLIYNFESNTMTKNVRQALDSIINRQSIVDHIFNGHASVTTGPFKDQDVKNTFNSAHAKALMEKEGYSDKNPLTLRIGTYDGRPELNKILETLQSDAKKAHINIEIKSVDDIEAFLDDTSQFDASMYSFLTEPRGSKTYYFEMAYLPEGSINKGAYNNVQVTDLIEERRQTVDLDRQKEIDDEILQITEEDIVNSYIARTENVVAFNKNVTGIQATPEAIEFIDYQVDIND